ncbi:diaminopimelate decarboxylase [Oceanibacterium hippocampi]|uniref:Diaminopimelate decarboxylase n=1 Tax=Oceanibacterium hippocampi TaxID=745714 RepID=A0A1Y5RVL1_9PROT|nr:diaminopimelate decarboxylase [Oceanibacterium hippocampi]SLN26548.1 Diaminopimelate decarboxylase [Oceanibacterium hippocampi]
MNHFEYRDGELHAEGVPLADIARAVGTPFYCYSTATLERHYRVFAEAFAGQRAKIFFSLKANSNLAVVRTLARLGAGADVVSGGELRRALQAGIPAGSIVFSGVGKTRDEIALALDAGIYQFNVESEPELAALSALAEARGETAPITIRVNPDVDAGTHEKISTGKAENKFGIPWTRARAVYAEAAAMPGIRIVGVDVHIGSQLTDLLPFEAAFARVVELVHALRADGHDIQRIDLGGGLGIPYDMEQPPLPAAYGAMVGRITGNVGCEIQLEPGRLIAGNAGLLVSEVTYVKSGASRTFVILDTAMNDLIRPALYDAYMKIVPVREAASGTALQPVDFVGPVCETGDTFARERLAPPLAAGDLVAICSAGAYGAVMASTYNMRPLLPEVLVNGDRFAVVRARQSVEDLLSRDRLPDWLDAAPPARDAAQ